MRKKYYGPPGTGKTTTIVKELEGLKRVVDPEQMFALSFTRSAKWAMFSKAPFVPIDNIRTLHSFASRALGLQKENFMKKSQVKAFFSAYGLSFEEEADDEEQAFSVVESRTDGGELYQLINYAKNRWGWNYYDYFIDFYRRNSSDFGLKPERALKIAKDFDAYMQSLQCYDYTEILRIGVRQAHALNFAPKVLVLDEFQDITPLMWEILKHIVNKAGIVLVAGDDDQSIFSFAGSDPAFLIGFEAEESVLAQSFRLPKAVHRLAMRLISKNRKRKVKQYKPRDEEGVAEFVHKDWVLDCLKGESVLLLARNRWVVDEWVQELNKHGIPYGRLGAKQKLPKVLELLKILDAWRKGEEVDEEDVKKVVEWDDKTFSFRKLAGYRPLGWETQKPRFVRAFLQKDTGYEVIRKLLTLPLPHLFTDEVARRWIPRLKNAEEWLKPKVKVGTIHQAKGLEAETVILDTRMSKKVWIGAEEDAEPERRVLYVGITRAKQRLYLVDGDGYTYRRLGWI